MTNVFFYFNVENRHKFACRLARKAFLQDMPMVISGQRTELEEIDGLLWRLSESDFVAHDWLGCTEEQNSYDLSAPILLLPDSTLPKSFTKTKSMLNLWDDVAACFSQFEHIYEIVLRENEHDRTQARKRWRYYQQRGYTIKNHDLSTGKTT